MNRRLPHTCARKPEKSDSFDNPVCGLVSSDSLRSKQFFRKVFRAVDIFSNTAIIFGDFRFAVIRKKDGKYLVGNLCILQSIVNDVLRINPLYP